MADLPIACTLTADTIKTRRAGWTLPGAPRQLSGTRTFLEALVDGR